MFNMMLGIADWLGNMLSGLFGWLINALVEFIVIPLISAIVFLIKYLFAGMFYSVSCFLLNLIDLLEMLFRSLAGLDSAWADGRRISLTLSGGGKFAGGDLLLQILTSEEIIMAFQATAIVGIFLLIIMTIFQMIKVEYTTEGAENNKTKIMGKSLKSLTNLLLIPALCIFGVFIGNQILDLIDTATKGGENTKISGTLFATAASGAMYQPNSDIMKITHIDDMIEECIEFSINYLLGQDPKFEKYSEKTDPETVERGFMQCSENYYYANISDVTDYYNIFEINYLVLIFGACIILKCLFNVTFGMIDRLYRCIALFITVPFVIGMSPIKDSLSSWRTNFIGKALSAYGTVISMNLFFIIVDILLQVDIKIENLGIDAFGLTSSFMEGLIKAIFVIVGCMMIEKLAADMGNYFGASDAMAAGKGLAGEATAGLKKAAAVGTGIAMGGAGLVMKGVGLAGKFGKGELKFQKSARGKDLINDEGSIKDKLSANNEALDKLAEADNKDDLQFKDVREWQKLSTADPNSLNDAQKTKLQGLENKLKIKTDEDRTKANQVIANADKNKAIRESKRAAIKDENKGYEQNLSDIDAYKHSWRSEEGRKEKAGKVSTGIGLGYAGLKHYGQEGIKSALPKDITGFSGAWEKHMEAGAANNDDLKAAYEAHKEAKTNREKARFNDPITQHFSAVKQQAMITMLSDQVDKSSKDLVDATTKGFDKMVKSLDNLADKMKYYEKSTDEAGKANFQYYQQQYNQKREEFAATYNIQTEKDGSISDKALNDARNNIVSDLKTEMDAFKKIFADNQGKSKKDIIKALEDHLANMGKDPSRAGHMEQMMKMLEEIKETLNK